MIEEALAYGRSKGWIASGLDAQLRLAHDLAESLHKKLKGQSFINQALDLKGLPALELDPARELEKARLLIENKFSVADLEDPQNQAKAARLLASRGFDEDTAMEIIFKRS